MLGVLATAALLGVGVAIATMVAPDSDPELPATVAATGTPSPSARADREDRPRKPRLTARERAARREAVQAVKEQGYTPVSLAPYRPDRDLRVLVGAPTGDPNGGRRAFFFYKNTYAGTDTMVDSARIKVLDRGGRRWVTLQYRLYGPDNMPCCPSGPVARVRFEWTGESVQPIDPMPDPDSRIERG